MPSLQLGIKNAAGGLAPFWQTTHDPRVTRISPEQCTARRDVLLVGTKPCFANSTQTQAEHEATGSSVCIAVIGVDHYMAISDTHGHDAGDTALRHFAKTCP